MERSSLIERLKDRSLTDFEMKVLAATLSIKRGRVKTYRQIAREIGHPRAYRAVGTALSKNPFPVLVPCHRVIRSDGSIGGYANGKKKKIALLRREGYL